MDYSVKLTVDYSDRMMDLKLAFMESKLSDLYDDVKFLMCHNNRGTVTHMKIIFANADDLLHWTLTFQDAFTYDTHVNNWLTYSNFMP